MNYFKHLALWAFGKMERGVLGLEHSYTICFGLKTYRDEHVLENLEIQRSCITRSKMSDVEKRR